MGPMRTLQIRKKYDPTLELMKQMDTIQKNASQTGEKDDWKKYKHIRNQINNRLRYE